MYEPVDTIQWSPSEESSANEEVCNNARCLPAEILQTIMKSMDSKELLLCRLINTTWNELSDKVLKFRATADWHLNAFSPSYIPLNNRSVTIPNNQGQNVLTEAGQEGRPNPRVTVPTGCVVATIYSNEYADVANYVDNAGQHILSFTCHFVGCSNIMTWSRMFSSMKHQFLAYVINFLLDVLSKMPNLQELAINESFHSPRIPIGHEGDRPEPSFQDISLPPLPHLKCLEMYIDTKNASAADIFYYRSIICSFGTSLITLKCYYNLLDNLYNQSMSLPFKNLRALKLKIDNHDANIFKNIADVFSHIPKLEYLWVQSEYVAFVEFLTKMDEMKCPLKEIHFEVDYQGNDEPPGEEMRPAFVDERGHQCLEIKRGIRQNVDGNTPTLISQFVDMIRMNKKFNAVKVLTLPWLQSTGYWRKGGVRCTLKMFPNLKTLHFTQCNYWTYRYADYSTKKRYPDCNQEHNKIVANLIAEFKRDGHGLEFFKLLPKLEKVQFFPDCESADRDAFLSYMSDKKDTMKTVSNVQVPVNLKRFKYPHDDHVEFNVFESDSDDDDGLENLFNIYR